MENQNNECCNQHGCCEGENNKKKFGWGKMCGGGLATPKHCGGGCNCSNIFMSVGVALAVVLSWSAKHSIIWAIIHGLLNWFYVIYYLIVNR
ncbi:MAG TPA: hypothetical protein PKX30_00700 [Candidatus Pacearchaeota archaeon]|nr:hypothetical protein [Candidatus Pacearchaeota archaeon]